MEIDIPDHAVFRFNPDDSSPTLILCFGCAVKMAVTKPKIKVVVELRCESYNKCSNCDEYLN